MKNSGADELYSNNKILDYLCMNRYDEIALIDLKHQKLSLRQFHPDENISTFELDIDYETFRQERADTCISEDVRSYFLEHTSLDFLQKNLEQNPLFTFQVYQFAGLAERRLKEYQYNYFDRENGIIFVVTEDITTLSEKDLLTGGLNRQGLIHHVRRIVLNSTENENFAILYFNIKDFKAINELFGVGGGDDVLRYFNQELCNSTMHPYVVARIEADHFACLVKRENLDYQELIRICQSCFLQEEKKYSIYARCGIYFIEDKLMSVNQMCDRAKLAKEYIQDEFVQPYAVFDRYMRNAYIDRTEALADLNRALDNHEFEIYYQPVFHATTQKIVSAEALIRWNHPEKGFISPAVFIPAFEEGGHISKVDLFVAKEVQHFIEERYANHKFLVPISINLSWMDFYDKNMMQTILNSLRGNDVCHNYLRFEVTETSYAIMAENNKLVLETLKDIGAKILLDDFGSGYSSFSTIQNYDFDTIKLDMGFVQKIKKNKKTEQIIQTIIDMAHHVNATVIAEGAETADQVEFLTRNACDYIQGYYFSKPLPQKDFIELLEKKGEM